MNPIRLGIVSVDHMHAYAYAEALGSTTNAVLVGIFDEEPARGEAAATQFKTRMFSQLDSLLDEVDGILICSDNVRHYPYAKKAAEAGVHVLVEKPLTTNGDEGRQLIDLCHKQRVNLMTAFPVRFNSAVQKVQQQVEQGEIGDIVAIAATNHGKMPGGWFIDPQRSGGGTILDHTVHAADIMRRLLGCEAEEVYAEAGTLLHDIPVEDCGLLSIRFEDGVMATLDTSWSRPSSFPRWGSVTMRIVGTKGVLHLDTAAQAGDMWVDDEGLTHQQVAWGESADAALIEEFTNSVIEKRQPFVTGLDGLRATEMAWSAYESVRTGKPAPVKHY